MVRGPNMRVAIAAAALLLAGGGTAAQITLDADNLRNAAAISLKDGDAARALAYANALVQRDATDFTAHLIRARALRDLGQNTPARSAARTAWALAQTDAEKYAAALITAQVLSSGGKRTRAQLWLRRAAQHAPNDRLEAKAKRDFRYVQQRNPWSTRLSFTLAPNSNINNGSARERSELNYAVTELLFGQTVEYDLNGTAQALSGIEYGGALSTRYRFKQSATTAHDLKFALSYRSFSLSSGAQSQAPNMSGSDFAYGTASLGYGFKRLNFEGKGSFEANVEAGQSWYGGARYATFLQGSVQQSYRPSKHRQYRFGVTLDREWGQATPDTNRFGLSAGMTQRHQGGNLGFFGVNAITTQSPNPDSEYAELGLRTGLVMAKPVMGADVQLGLGAAYRDYDVSRHSRDGRQDLRVFADVTATFSDVEYYGFNPSVSLNISRTNSNIGLFDTERLGMSVGIKSAF